MTDLPITVHEGEGFASPENLHWRPGYEDAPYRYCGYCGSLHPEDFAVAPASKIDRTDMKYGWPHKVYIELTNPDPDRLYCMSSTSVANERLRPWTALSDEEKAAVQSSRANSDTPWEPDHLGRFPGFGFGQRKTLFGKFYTAHLLEPTLDPEVADRCFARIGKVIERGEKPGSVQWRPYVYPR